MQLPFDKNVPSAPKRVAVFASYDGQGVVREYVLYYLKELRKVVDAIVFVADNAPASEEEVRKLEDLVVYASFVRHQSYDFGSYKLGFMWARENGLLDSAEELVFCNDSCYGPVYPFSGIFDEMVGRRCDFWGMSYSPEICWHIQSFFMVFKRKVFTSPVFYSFVDSFCRQKSFWDYVMNYEVRFAEYLKNYGFICDVYLRIDDSEKENLYSRFGVSNLTVMPYTLHRKGMPLVKKKVFIPGSDYLVYSLSETPDFLDALQEVNMPLYDILVKEMQMSGFKLDQQDGLKEDVQVVYFDLLDSLLAYPYVKPEDRFEHMEREFACKGFAQKRINAEQMLTRNHDGSYTLDMIYSRMPLELQCMKERELKFDKDIIYVRPSAEMICHEASKKNLKIFAVSDSYYPKSFIDELLRAKGLGEMVTVLPMSQELYEKTRSGKYIHITDKSNTPVNYQVPYLSKFIEYSKTGTLEASSILGLIRYHSLCHAPKDALYEIGYVLGGPLALAMSTPDGGDADIVSKSYLVHLYNYLMPIGTMCNGSEEAVDIPDCENHIDKENKDKLIRIRKGILDFLENYKRLFSGHSWTFTIKSWQTLAECYLRCATFGDKFTLKRIWIRASDCRWQSLWQMIDAEMQNSDVSYDSEYLIYKQRLKLRKRMKHIRLLVWISLLELLGILILLCL